MFLESSDGGGYPRRHTTLRRWVIEQCNIQIQGGMAEGREARLELLKGWTWRTSPPKKRKGRKTLKKWEVMFGLLEARPPARAHSTSTQQRPTPPCKLR